jgi:hypothetical protein
MKSLKLKDVLVEETPTGGMSAQSGGVFGTFPKDSYGDKNDSRKPMGLYGAILRRKFGKHKKKLSEAINTDGKLINKINDLFMTGGTIKDVRNLFYFADITDKDEIYKICRQTELTVNDSLAVAGKIQEPY